MAHWTGGEARTYYLAADSKADMDEWIQAIQDKIEYLSDDYD